MECSQLPSLEQRLAQIRTALAELTLIQTQLKKNASDSKSSIQCTFSRQLEALRSREVHLLTQVETLLQVKQDHLQLQAEGLQQELGALEALLDHARTSGNAVSLQDVENIMKRFQQVQLSHSEDALLGFEGDAKELKKAILTFGHVNAKRRRMDTDSDCSSMSKQIIGAFEQFAGPQVWLCKVKSGSGLDASRPHMIYPIFMEKGDCHAWLFKADSDCNSSMDSSSSPYDGDDSFVMVPENPKKMNKSFSSHFARILNSPDIEWIRPASNTANVGISPLQQRRAYTFYRPGGSTKDWVRQPSTQTQDKVMDTSSNSVCSPSQQAPTKAIEIEDLADLVCCQDTPSAASSQCSPKANQPKEEKNTSCCWTPAVHHFRVKTSEAVDINDVCKGNEKCNTFSECLCDDNCGDSAAKHNPTFNGVPESSKNQWLVTSPCVSTKSEDAESDVMVLEEEMPKADLVKEWLASKTSPAVEILTSDTKLACDIEMSETNSSSEKETSMSSIISSFIKWQLEQETAWVKTPTLNSSGSQQQQEANRVSEWLMKKAEANAVDNRQIVEEEKQPAKWLVPKSPIGSTPAFKRSVDTTCWLRKKDQGTSEVDNKEDAFQEKWLVKQAPGMKGLTNNPASFPEFTAPMNVNQWLKN